MADCVGCFWRNVCRTMSVVPTPNQATCERNGGVFQGEAPPPPPSCSDDPNGYVAAAGFNCRMVMRLGCAADLHSMSPAIPAGSLVSAACPASCDACPTDGGGRGGRGGRGGKPPPPPPGGGHRRAQASSCNGCFFHGSCRDMNTRPTPSQGRCEAAGGEWNLASGPAACVLSECSQECADLLIPMYSECHELIAPIMAQTPGGTEFAETTCPATAGPPPAPPSAGCVSVKSCAVSRTTLALESGLHFPKIPER